MKNQGVRSSRLPGGVMVVTEHIPHFASISLGVWTGIGSRDEAPTQNGAAHFFEHMAFKGTPNYSALDIVKHFESTGGHVNAYTTKEYTCFYGKVVADEAKIALDVLLEMTLAPVLDKEEFKKEKEVILEEIRGGNDNPDERVYDILGSSLFGKHPLSRPIAGTLASVRKLKIHDLEQHLQAIRETYPLCISAVGSVDHDWIVEQVSAWLKSNKLLIRKKRNLRDRKKIPFKLCHIHENKDLEQASVVLAFPAYPLHDPRCFAVSLLNVMLGEGMSSRLFQEVREKLGLVYQIGSYTEFLEGIGFLAVTFSADAKHLSEAYQVIGKELEKLAKEGLTADELNFAKKYVKGNFLLEMESPQARAAFIARMALYEGRLYTQERYLKGYDRWSLPKINAVIKDVLGNGKWGSAAVLPKRVAYKPNVWM